MAWKQLIAPDLSVEDYAGWCARFTWKVFQQQSVYNYGSAIEAWNGVGNPYPQHPDSNIPQGMSVPIYYDWGQYGHAAVFVSGRGILSSPGSGYGQQWFDSIEACGNYFGATYLGWREDMAGVPVIEFIKEPTPVPNQKGDEMLGAFYRNPSGSIAWQEKPNTVLIPIGLVTWQAYAKQGNKYLDVTQEQWDKLVNKWGTATSPSTGSGTTTFPNMTFNGTIKKQ